MARFLFRSRHGDLELSFSVHFGNRSEFTSRTRSDVFSDIRRQDFLVTDEGSHGNLYKISLLLYFLEGTVAASTVSILGSGMQFVVTTFSSYEHVPALRTAYYRLFD